MDLSQSVENEFFCLKFFKNCTLNTADVEIGDFEGKKALVVTRFDRSVTPERIVRLPQEDLCQAFGVPVAKKYEGSGGPGMVKILNFLNQSDQRAEDRSHFFISQVLFWLLAATDGHAKNFSILLDFWGGFKLSPVYDVLSVQPMFDKGQIPRNKVNLAMKVGKNRRNNIHGIEPRYFLETAEEALLPVAECQEILAVIKKHIPIILEKTRADLPVDFPMDLADSISNGVLERLKKL